MAPSTPTLISSVRRALVLLEAVAEHGEITAKRLSRETRLPLPTTYHLLRTLVHDGYLRRERGTFRLGPAVPRLAGRGPGPGPGVRLAEWLGVLRDELGAPVYYADLADGEVRVVAVAESPERRAVEEWADSGRPRTPTRSASACSPSCPRRPAAPIRSAAPWPG
ncbi:helix-turn-helix domain-containing protein [Streptomyces sp. NBC_01255]|uniref:helix-turn-helix domain-containing protein n=1 Tax=Streptomyces sp. NBC_01255 TaxID=2903798 RepID=UPI002E37FBE7|nr:helix-turn-helix domain-containing protein [Streptomyces sp. NBC_01255]